MRGAPIASAPACAVASAVGMDGTTSLFSAMQRMNSKALAARGAASPAAACAAIVFASRWSAMMPPAVARAMPEEMSDAAPAGAGGGSIPEGGALWPNVPGGGMP